MDSFKTPLRYPGGKRALYPFIASILEWNNLTDGFYIEPFAGGSGVALELLLREYVQHVYLNDADPHIFAFWHSLINEPEAFIKLVTDTPVSVDQWKRQKTIFSKVDEYSVLEIGFSTFYLNRCNRSGILGGRPVGGLDQSGPWKIDARFNKENLIRRIEMIAIYRERIHVFGLDAKEFLADRLDNIEVNKTLIYLDPPYYVMGGELYLNNFSHTDHIHLSQLIKQLPYRWVLSYDNVPQIQDMYSDLRCSIISLYYRANERKVGKELVFFSNNLVLPKNVVECN